VSNFAETERWWSTGLMDMNLHQKTKFQRKCFRAWSVISIHLALICVPPFDCGRLNTSCSLNSFFEIPWFDGWIRPPVRSAPPPPGAPPPIPSPCALIATKFDTSCSWIFSSKFRCLMVDRHAWLIDWLLAFGFCKFDTSCSYGSQLCPSPSVPRRRGPNQSLQIPQATKM